MLHVLSTLCLLILFIEASSTLNESVSTSSPPLILMPGLSFSGLSASKLLSQISESVAVLLIIDNWSRWALIEPQLDLKCGRVADINEGLIKTTLPDVIQPGYSEMALFEKENGLTGVCGVVSYLLESSSSPFVHILFSVPFNLNLHGQYVGVGMTEVFVNISGRFDLLYYHDSEESFSRERAGNLAEFVSDKVVIRGTMEPDAYKTIVRILVLPTNPKDKFVPGKYVPLKAGAKMKSYNFHYLCSITVPAILINALRR